MLLYLYCVSHRQFTEALYDEHPHSLRVLRVQREQFRRWSELLKLVGSHTLLRDVMGVYQRCYWYQMTSRGRTP